MAKEIDAHRKRAQAEHGVTLKHLHDELDAAVADAYGWPRDLPEAEVLARLVALNKERAAEEARGLVRWLRPDYQIPRFGSVKEKAELELVGGAGVGMTADKTASAKPNFPAKDIEQTVAVTMALVRATAPLSAAEIARQFKRARRSRTASNTRCAPWRGWGKCRSPASASP